MSGSLEGPLPLGSIGKESEDDTGSINTNWTESTDVPRREMKFLQVFSMMVNQMIGSGIFNTPAYILLLTKSKQLSLVLWFLGGVYTFLR